MPVSDKIGGIEENFERCMDVLARWDEGASLQRMLEEDGVDVRVRNSLLTIFRRRASIDWLIDEVASGKTKRPLRNLLRWAVCQVVPLRGIPGPVAVSFSVDMARKHFGESTARFVNALLRRVSDAEKDGSIGPWLARAPEWVRLELSKEMYDSWRRFLSHEQLVELAEVMQQPAPVTARLRRGYEVPETVAASLDPIANAPFLQDLRFFAIRQPGTFFRHRSEWQGTFYIQDPATGLAPLMMRAVPGETVGDLCAAPGGKTIILSERMEGRGLLLAADRSVPRLPKLRENFETARIPVHVLAADVSSGCIRPATLDGALLDVPCSNSGVARRRPDVRWRYAKQDKAAIVELQRNILEGVLPAVREGGRIVYSTCSIDPDENAEQVRSFVERHPACSLEDERQLYPANHHDGAYAARIRVDTAQKSKREG